MSPSDRPPLSVLDLAIVSAGSDSATALAATTEVARLADDLGYRRFWVAEHHNMRSVASTTPPVLMAHLAASTRRIRVGSGGIMLPNHPPLVVAEHVAALEALHPGRIDVGIGRAPGTDPRTAAALRRSPAGLSVEDFPRDLLDLMGLLGDRRTERGLWEHFRATPQASTRPEVVLLGSSGYSAQLAGVLGLPFAFAHHFDTGGTLQAAALYRESFQPSPVLDRPRLIVTANVIVAPSEEEAQWEAGPGRVMVRGIRVGRFEPLCTPEQAVERLGRREPGGGPSSSSRVVGTPAHAVGALESLAAATGADELMVSTVTHGLDARLRSLRLLADAWASAATGAGDAHDGAPLASGARARD